MTGEIGKRRFGQAKGESFQSNRPANTACSRRFAFGSARLMPTLGSVRQGQAWQKARSSYPLKVEFTCYETSASSAI